MFPLTFREFQQLSQCRFPGNASRSIPVSGAAIDSRNVLSGDIFVALPGHSHHGLDFAEEAFAAGCSLVLTASSCFERYSPAQQHKLLRYPIALVDDAVVALQTLAAWNRRQSTAEVIAVTGSVGKTTTRGLIASVLRQAGPTVESPHNYNNQLGVPLTLLQISPEHRFAVVEIGSSSPGEIAPLAALARPTHAVITRITAAHLDGLKSIDCVAEEKLSLLNHLTDGGTAWLNANDDVLKRLAAESGAASEAGPGGAGFRWKPKAHWNLKIRMVSGDSSQVPQNSLDPPRLCVTVRGRAYTAAVVGQHNAFAVRAAAELGHAFDLRDAAIQSGLDKYRGQPGRCEIIPAPFGRIVNDTYNASPASVKAAIQLISNWPNVGRRILVLGDMLELGPNAAKLHAEIGITISQSEIDQVWLAGASMHSTAEAIQSLAVPQPHVRWFPTVEELSRALATQAAAGAFVKPASPTEGSSDGSTVILVKGSRGMRMERVVALLRDHPHDASTSD